MYKFLFIILFAILFVFTYQKTHLNKKTGMRKSYCKQNKANYARKWWFYSQKCRGFKIGERNPKCTQKCLKHFKNNKNYFGICGITWFGYSTCNCCLKK